MAAGNGACVLACAVVAACGSVASAQFGGGGSTLPAVEFPAENPFSEAKRVLGKLLFFDEQLSSDSTIACATCHIPGSGGADPRLAVNPGPDGIVGTPDDLLTSAGVIRQDASASYEPDPVFGLDRQLTSRAANTSIMAMYADELFWDGRATTEFVDPETGGVVIPGGAALESQAVEPVVSEIEMSHPDRDWVTVTAKIENAVPWALATDHTPDVAAVLADEPTYPELFEAAFGDAAVTAARIGMAIATYERTLVPDQTPFDRFAQGESGAMTPRQQQGLGIFLGSDCNFCHTSPLFTDNRFHTIGLRRNSDDIGRAGVTGQQQDRGAFKTPTLRNVGLKRTLMHTGQFTSVNQVFPFYAGPGAPGVPNRDPVLPSPIAPQAVPAVADFIANALTDPRVENEEFPFDRPTLRSELPANPAITGAGVAGSGGLTPRMIALSPPYVGNADFMIGIERGLAGATAEVAISSSPPAGGVVALDETSGVIVLEGLGIGNGFATFHWPVPADGSLDGTTVWMQWRVDDPSAPGGVALSPAARVDLFCGGWCPPEACVADLAEPFGVLDLADISAFVGAFVGGEPAADLAEPIGVLDLSDIQAFVSSFTAGCP
jgi:cytochrome c peroxidase